MNSLITRIYIQSERCVATFEFLLNNQILEIEQTLDVFESVNSTQNGTPWGFRRMSQSEITTYSPYVSHNLSVCGTSLSFLECNPKKILNWMPSIIVREFLNLGDKIIVTIEKKSEKEEISLLSLFNS